MKHGFLLINKPVGPTSHDVVGMVRKALSERKIGHLGTLDPAASGLMVLAVGAKALKVVELFTDLSKEYVADITLGAVSSTFDREGVIEPIERKPGVPEPKREDIDEAIRSHFLGNILQVPPVHSAVSLDGVRAYQLARQGESVDMPERTVQIDACDVLSYVYPDLKLRVACGSGTYIRSLAHDLGQAVRTGAYLAALERTKVGEWSLENAVDPTSAAWSRVLPLKEVLKDLPGIELTDDEMDDIRHGRAIERDCQNDTLAWHNDLPVALLKSLGEGVCRARKVF